MNGCNCYASVMLLPENFLIEDSTQYIAFTKYSNPHKEERVYKFYNNGNKIIIQELEKQYKNNKIIFVPRKEFEIIVFNESDEVAEMIANFIMYRSIEVIKLISKEQIYCCSEFSYEKEIITHGTNHYIEHFFSNPDCCIKMTERAI